MYILRPTSRKGSAGEQSERCGGGKSDGQGYIPALGFPAHPVLVEKGTVEWIEGTDQVPGIEAVLCAKGPPGLAMLHDGERCQHPMNRTGPPYLTGAAGPAPTVNSQKRQRVPFWGIPAETKITNRRVPTPFLDMMQRRTW